MIQQDTHLKVEPGMVCPPDRKPEECQQLQLYDGSDQGSKACLPSPNQTPIITPITSDCRISKGH